MTTLPRHVRDAIAGKSAHVFIDPGVKQSAYAVSVNDVLRACGLGDGACALAQSYCRSARPSNVCVLIESPVAYAGQHANDLIALARIVGQHEATFRALGCEVVTTTPAEWKQQQQKPPHHMRTLNAIEDRDEAVETEAVEHGCGRTWDDIYDYVKASATRLARGEPARYSRKDHNTLDAVAGVLTMAGRL